MSDFYIVVTGDATIVGIATSGQEPAAAARVVRNKTWAKYSIKKPLIFDGCTLYTSYIISTEVRNTDEHETVIEQQIFNHLNVP